jgi:hypothetical protein
MNSVRDVSLAILAMVLVMIAGPASAKQPKGVVVENPATEPVPVVSVGPVVTQPSDQRVSIVTFVSLESADLSEESGPIFTVPEGKRLVIEHVQSDAGGACGFKWIPIVIVDRPVPLGTIFDRYDLAVITQEAFAGGGGAFRGAISQSVAITAQSGSVIRFGFRRNASGCFSQADFKIDGRLEDGDAFRVPEGL